MNARQFAYRAYVGVLYVVLFVPPLYTVYLSLYPTPSPIVLVPERFTLKWFGAALADPTIVRALRTSLLVSAVAAVATTGLSLVGARGFLRIESQRRRELLLLLFLTPVLVPGIVLGLGLTVYFDLIGVATGVSTLVLVGMLWSLPFALLILLTTYSNLRRAHRLASYDLGASPWYTFRRIELPLIVPGLLGSLFFSFLFTFNEYVRSSFVKGTADTVPIRIFSLIEVQGLPPEMYAVSTIMIAVTATGIGTYVYYNARVRG